MSSPNPTTARNDEATESYRILGDSSPEPNWGVGIDFESESGEDDEYMEFNDVEGQVDDDEDEEDEDEEDEEEDDDFHDADDGLNGVEIAFSLEEEENEEEEAGGENGAPPRRQIYLSREQMMQLLRHAGLGRVLSTGSGWGRRPTYSDSEEDVEDEEQQDTGYGVAPKKKRNRGRQAFQKVPSEAGQKLMETGTFGANDRLENTFRRNNKLMYRLMQRELGLGSRGAERSKARLIKQGLIPSSTADMIVHYDDRCYSGQFSNDGNFFFSCSQDFKVRMYDTSNPYDWKYYKKVSYPYGQWTITDASLSPDNKFLAYSSIRSVVCLAPTDPANDSEPHQLDFANTGRGNRRGILVYPYFGIWSLRFSGDGREIVAGTGDNSVYVYDIERRETILRINGHDDDVNAVCFGDSQSPHILYSGSDDTTLKVWDRRSMGDGREAGVFLGHTEGLTYVDSKGDGRYILSNGKDQTAKLWDLRMMMSKEKADSIDRNRYTTGFEYRSNAYDEDYYRPHPHDCSLVTFRGHQVLKTLIRCHFSPPGSTDSRYVYSGSYDGSVYIWNMDATLAGKVDVLKATKHSRPRDLGTMAESYEFIGRTGVNWHTCVRDASWHPSAPIIAATSWNGWGTSLGTCTVHSWNDGLEDDEAEPKMGRRVDPELRHDEDLYRAREAVPSSYIRRRGR